MSYADQLATEINAFLDRLADDGQPWRPTWIAHAICVTHSAGLPDGEHALFWRHCGHVAVRDQVRRCMSKRTGPPVDGDRAPTLPGFSHLQMYYSVKRGAEEIGVHVRHLTDGELREKIAFLRAMGGTCYAHAEELAQFMRERRAGEGSAAGAA